MKGTLSSSPSAHGEAAPEKKRHRRAEARGSRQRSSLASDGVHHATHDDKSDANVARQRDNDLPVTATDQQLHHLTKHVNELTRSIELSLAHKFDVLEHVSAGIDGRGSAGAEPLLSRAAGCAVHPFETAVVSCRNEGQFQKLLVDSMAQRMVPPTSTWSRAHKSQRHVAAAMPPFRITQVHNSVREFRLACRSCASHRVEHTFGIHGTLGDVHVVTSDDDGGSHSTATATPSRRSMKRSGASHPHHKMSFLSLPPKTAVIVEVKHATALNRTMLAQALLELELHKDLVCCQGRACAPEDKDLTPAAVLKKPLTNCACTEKEAVVLVLWGAQSCAITSRCKATGARDLMREARVLEWVRQVHDGMLRCEELAAAARKETALLVSHSVGGGRDDAVVDPHNLLNVVRPLPHVRLDMRTHDGTSLGAVAWEVLSIHPSIDMTPLDQPQIINRTEGHPWTSKSDMGRGSGGRTPPTSHSVRSLSHHESAAAPPSRRPHVVNPLAVRRQKSSVPKPSHAATPAHPLLHKKRRYATIAAPIPSMQPYRAASILRWCGVTGWGQWQALRYRILFLSIALRTNATLVRLW